MPRNLDMTALRSFVAVSDAGGVTRAANLLNLTQSAVSMQLKRLEEALGASLLDRSARTVSLTAEGAQLLGYARRMVDLNDEAIQRLTSDDYEGVVTLGVPHDIVYPAIPQVLRRFSSEYPRMKTELVSSFTTRLKRRFAAGDADIILTTEEGCDAGGETITVLPLIWIGAPGGQAWKRRPLQLAFERDCIFRRDVQRALDRAGITWEIAVEAESYRTVGAMVSADLAVHALLDGTAINDIERIRHGGALPELASMNVNLYVNRHKTARPVEDLAGFVRQAFTGLRAAA